MELTISYDLEAFINLISNSTSNPNQAREIGFVITIQDRGNKWISNTAYKDRDLSEIINREEKYTKLNKFLDNNPNVKLIPWFHSDSPLLSNSFKNSLNELSIKGYDTILISGFATQLYKIEDDKKYWDSINVVKSIPSFVDVFSNEFLKIYSNIKK